MTVDPSKRLTIDQVLAHSWVTNADNIEEGENNQDDNDAFENMKNYNIMRRLIKCVYGLIAYELTIRAESEAFMSNGCMTKEAMFNNHK